MTNSSGGDVKTAKAPMPVASGPVTFDVMLAKLSARDRGNLEKHLAACEAQGNGRHAEVWKRLSLSLMNLAGHSMKLCGRSGAQFYQADGKYRMQVYALEDVGEGKVCVYCTDVLERALTAKLVTAVGAGAESDHFRAGKSTSLLTITRLSGATTDPAPLYKDMLGWNRRALCMELPDEADDKQVSAIEAVCALSLTR